MTGEAGEGEIGGPGEGFEEGRQPRESTEARRQRAGMASGDVIRQRTRASKWPFRAKFWTGAGAAAAEPKITGLDPGLGTICALPLRRHLSCFRALCFVAGQSPAMHRHGCKHGSVGAAVDVVVR